MGRGWRGQESEEAEKKRRKKTPASVQSLLPVGNQHVPQSFPLIGECRQFLPFPVCSAATGNSRPQTELRTLFLLQARLSWPWSSACSLVSAYMHVCLSVSVCIYVLIYTIQNKLRTNFENALTFKKKFTKNQLYSLFGPNQFNHTHKWTVNVATALLRHAIRLRFDKHMS